jgi:hypothetical protein
MMISSRVPRPMYTVISFGEVVGGWCFQQLCNVLVVAREGAYGCTNVAGFPSATPTTSGRP